MENKEIEMIKNELLKKYVRASNCEKKNRILHVLRQVTGRNYNECMGLAIDALRKENENLKGQIVDQIGENAARRMLFLIEEEKASLDNPILMKYYQLGKRYVEEKNQRLESHNNSGYYSIYSDKITRYIVQDLCQKKNENELQIDALTKQIERSEEKLKF